MSAQAKINPKVTLEQFVEATVAFRSTLPTEQQVLLDAAMASVNYEVDVEAHSISPRVARADAASVQFAADSAISVAKMAAAEKAQDDIEDVEAHALSGRLEVFGIVAAEGAYVLTAVAAVDNSIPEGRIKD